MYTRIVRPLFFLLDPESAHHTVFRLLKLLLLIPGVRGLTRRMFCVNDRRLSKNVFGIEFPNPVGLAAGLDKDAMYYNDLSALGFGFIEVGTVTPLAQPGNDKPRLFRLPQDHALINRMGFNNDGVIAMAARLKGRDPRIIIGGNIGKNKNTPNENAADDYEKCFNTLYPYVDYFAVNVSSPNTAGLRSLQDKGPLLEILKRVQNLNRELSVSVLKPVLLKIAPDLNEQQLDEIVEVVSECRLNGIIAVNTTIRRDNLLTSEEKIRTIGPGGLSGRPLNSRSTEVIRYLASKKGDFAIIGVGGIHSAQDAIDKINAGADLVQLYTGFIYEGPSLIRQINEALLNSN